MQEDILQDNINLNHLGKIAAESLGANKAFENFPVYTKKCDDHVIDRIYSRCMLDGREQISAKEHRQLELETGVTLITIGLN